MAALTQAPAGSGAVSATRPDERHRRGKVRWVVLAGAALVALVMLVPFLIMLLNAFKSPAEYSANGPLSLPSKLYTDGLVNFWHRVNFPEKLVNSIVISGAVALLGTVVSLLNAYALGIGRVRGRLWIVAIFLFANMLPQEALIYPLYYLAKATGFYNNQLSVIIIFTVIQSAFGTYLLSSVFSTFPPSTNPIFDAEHFMFAFILLLLMWVQASNYWGIGRWWRGKTPAFLH